MLPASTSPSCLLCRCVQDRNSLDLLLRPVVPLFPTFARAFVAHFSAPSFVLHTTQNLKLTMCLYVYVCIDIKRATYWWSWRWRGLFLSLCVWGVCVCVFGGGSEEEVQTPGFLCADECITSLYTTVHTHTHIHKKTHTQSTIQPPRRAFMCVCVCVCVCLSVAFWLLSVTACCPRSCSAPHSTPPPPHLH